MTMEADNPHAPLVVRYFADMAEAADKLGDRLRTEVVAPFCRKHRLRWVSGMGTWFFTTLEHREHLKDQLSPDWLEDRIERWFERHPEAVIAHPFYSAMYQIYEAMAETLPLGGQHDVGMYVADFDPRQEA